MDFSTITVLEEDSPVESLNEQSYANSLSVAVEKMKLGMDFPINSITNKTLIGQLTSIAENELKRKLSCTSKVMIKLKQRISEEELTYLGENFPMFHIEVSGNDRAPHYELRALRTIIGHYIRYKLLGSPVGNCNLDLSKKYHVALKDVGSNPIQLVNAGWTSFHSCSPILNMADVHRSAAQTTQLKRIVDSDSTGSTSRGRIARRLLEHDATYCCRNMSQHCRITAPYMTFVHSIYDISHGDLFTMMDNAGASKAMGVILFDPVVLIYPSGKFTDLTSVNFEKYTEQNIKWIKFHFDGDTQDSYIHRWDTYIAIVMSFMMSSKSSPTVYSVMMQSYIRNHLIFEIVRVHSSMQPHQIARCIPFNTETNKFLRTYDLCSSSVMGYRMVVIPIYNNILERILTYAMMSVEGKFTYRQIFSIASSLNVRTVVNGQTVESKSKHSYRELQLLSVAAYVTVYYDRYHMSQMTKEFTDSMTAARASSFGRMISPRFYKDIKDIVTRHIVQKTFGEQSTIVADEPVDPLTVNRAQSLLDKIADFITSDRGAYPIKTGETLDYVQFQDIVPEIIHRQTNLLDDDLGVTLTLPHELLRYDESNVVIPDVDLPVIPTTERGVVSLVNYDCQTHLELITTPGDGDCLYHALRLSGATNDSASVIKRRLATSSKLTKEQKYRLSLQGHSDDIDTWGTSDDVVIFCAIYNTAVCLHASDGNVLYRPETYSSTQPVYHIRHHAAHFSALVAKRPDKEVVSIQMIHPRPLSDALADTIAINAAYDEFFKDIPSPVYSRIKNEICPIYPLDKGGFVCRSALKMCELHTFRDVDLFHDKIFDLCSGPGGFIEYILQNSAAVVHTIYGTISLGFAPSHSDISRIVPYHDKTANMDLLAPGFVPDMIDQITSNAGKFGLVLADGCVQRVGADSSSRVVENKEFIDNEISICFGILADRGKLVIKLFNPSHPVTRSQLTRLAERFTDVSIRFLHATPRTSSEFYAVCSGFLTEPREIELYNLDGFFSSVVFKYNAIRSNGLFRARCLRNYFNHARNTRVAEVVLPQTFVNTVICDFMRPFMSSPSKKIGGSVLPPLVVANSNAVTWDSASSPYHIVIPGMDCTLIYFILSRRAELADNREMIEKLREIKSDIQNLRRLHTYQYVLKYDCIRLPECDTAIVRSLIRAAAVEFGTVGCRYYDYDRWLSRIDGSGSDAYLEFSVSLPSKVDYPVEEDVCSSEDSFVTAVPYIENSGSKLRFSSKEVAFAGVASSVTLSLMSFMKTGPSLCTSALGLISAYSVYRLREVFRDTQPYQRLSPLPRRKTYIAFSGLCGYFAYKASSTIVSSCKNKIFSDFISSKDLFEMMSPGASVAKIFTEFSESLPCPIRPVVSLSDIFSVAVTEGMRGLKRLYEPRYVIECVSSRPFAFVTPYLCGAAIAVGYFSLRDLFSVSVNGVINPVETDDASLTFVESNLNFDISLPLISKRQAFLSAFCATVGSVTVGFFGSILTETMTILRQLTTKLVVGEIPTMFIRLGRNPRSLLTVLYMMPALLLDRVSSFTNTWKRITLFGLSSAAIGFVIRTLYYSITFSRLRPVRVVSSVTSTCERNDAGVNALMKRLLYDEKPDEIIAEDSMIKRDGEHDDNLANPSAVVAEYQDYLRKVYASALSNHARILRIFDEDERSRESIHREPGNYVVIDTSNRALTTVVGKLPKYRVKFYNGEFVPFGRDVTGLSVVSDYCMLALENDLNSATTGIHIDSVSDDVSVVQAAPGCGKTTEIISLLQKDSTSRVLVATRAGKVDFVQRLGWKDTPNEKRVRTITSYLLHPDRRFQCSTLYIDEAIMVHPGALILCIHLSAATHVRMYGDLCQIPFVNSLGTTFVMQYRYLSKVFKVTESRTMSYRCPVDVCAILSPLYAEAGERIGLDSQGMVPGPASVRKRSLALVKILGCDSVPKAKACKYLTFTQSDKETLLSKGFPDVQTVHEYQGMQSKLICIVRLSPIPTDEIYLRQSYAVVAISRHTHKLTYYTAFTDDVLSKMILSKYPTALTLGGGSTVYYSECISLPRPTRDSATFLIGSEICTTAPKMKLSAQSIAHHSPKTFTVKFDKMLPVHKIIDFSRFMNQICKKLARKVYYIGVDHIKTTSPKANDVMHKNCIVNFDTFDHHQFDDTPSFMIPIDRGISLPANATMLQILADQIFPGDGYTDNINDTYDMHSSILEITMSYAKFNLDKGTYSMPMYDRMTPTFQFPTPLVRPVTFREAILAANKRNFCVPELTLSCNIDEVAQDMVDNVIKTFFPSVDISAFDITSQDIDEWFDRQPSATYDKVTAERCLEDMHLDQYKFSIKRQPKPNLTRDASALYPALQTIVYSEKDVNAIFCPLINVIKTRIMASLRSGIFIMTDMSPEDFADHLTTNAPPHLLSVLNAMEIDISKYDKSQGALSLEYETRLMRALGVPERYIRLWYYSHNLSYITDSTTGLKFTTNYQRKSGDASTFLFNTLYLMGVIAHYFKGRQHIDYALFAGDDSLVFTKQKIKIDALDFGSTYNLEVKQFFFNHYYFCSKFLVCYNDRWVLIPDPVKVLVKLSRRDLVNPSHIEAYRISLMDLLKVYSKTDIFICHNSVFNERYKTNFDYSTFASTVSKTINDRNQFHNLWYIRPDDRIDFTRQEFGSYDI